MQLPILYKRTKTTKIQYWEIEVTQQEDYGVITKTSGQYGTDKPLENIEFVTEGKNLGKINQTSPLEQAQSQAQSDWNKKRDQGYKSLEDLEITNEEGVGAWSYKGVNYSKLIQALEAAVPTYNTDAQGNTKPILAQPLKWHKVTYPCLVNPKLDGVRCLVHFTGDDVAFFSRTGKPYTTLGHIGEELLSNLQEPIILDGEIYSHELTFQEITAAVKKQRDTSFKLKFRVYDIVNKDNQEARQRLLYTLLSNSSFNHTRLVEAYTCHSQQQVIDWHNIFVEQGYEGAMIRLLDGLYEQGQRSASLLKLKTFDTNEFEFVEFILGQRGVEDLIARCVTQDGLTFRAKMQGTVTEKEELFASTPPAGALLTIKHHGYTDQNLPRFPIGISFRDYE